MLLSLEGFLVPSLCHFTGMPRKLTNFQRNSLRKLSGVEGEVRKSQMEDMVRMLCKVRRVVWPGSSAVPTLMMRRSREWCGRDGIGDMYSLVVTYPCMRTW